ncbi:hypothetical protein EE612_033877 [Oryza sativa]|nr:hypothetical protein EE612_033877 [Oryza sativa]
MSGSAFKAFKSRVEVAWSPKLVRGLPGTRRLHRHTLEAMSLRRCHRTVEHRTTPSPARHAHPGQVPRRRRDPGDVRRAEAGRGGPTRPQAPAHRLPHPPPPRGAPAAEAH